MIISAHQISDPIYLFVFWIENDFKKTIMGDNFENV